MRKEEFKGVGPQTWNHFLFVGKRWMISVGEEEAAAYLARENAWVIGTWWTWWTCWIWRRADRNTENSCHSPCLQTNQKAEHECNPDTPISLDPNHRPRDMRGGIR